MFILYFATGDDVVDVDLYRLVQFNAELPGTSQLVIEMVDKNSFGVDEPIGKTVVDLEDRWFDYRWQEWGRENLVLPHSKDDVTTKVSERVSEY